jgi:putative pyrroloquinoline-quinone binding quinoprotein
MASSPRKEPLEITWRIFFALTGGCASGLLLLGLPFLAFGTLLAGFASHDERQQLAYMWLAALIATAWAATCAIALIKSGPLASNRMHLALWSIGLLVPFATVSLISRRDSKEHLRVQQEYIQTHSAEQVLWRGNEVKAGHAANLARAIADCANQYAKTHADAGYPSTLQELATASDKCAQEVAGLEKAADAHVNYTPALRDDSGRVRAFAVCAEPVATGPGANATFFDDLGEISIREWNGGRCHDAVAVDPELFKSRWEAEAYARRIKYCAFDYAAQHPDRGYPEQLSSLDRCATVSRVRSEGQMLFGDHGPVIGYVPGPADSSGRITSFTLERRAPCHPGSFGTISAIADVTGQLHVATRCRPARLTDPLLAEFDFTIGLPLERRPPPACTAPFPPPAKTSVKRWPEPNEPPPFPTDPPVDPAGYRSEVDGSSLKFYDGNGKLFWQKQFTGKIVPALTVADNRLYVLSAEERSTTLHAIRVTGEEDWSAPFLVKFDGPPVPRSDGTVYLAAGAVYAIAPDGSLKWAALVPDGVFFEPAVGRSGNVYVVAGAKLYGLDGETGGRCWGVSIGTLDDKPVAAAMIQDGLIYTRSAGHMVDIFTEPQ